MRPLRCLGFACVILGIFLLPSAALARPLEDVKASGELIVAVYENFAPYSYEENGEPKGLDVAIGKALAEKMGLKPRFLLRMSGETMGDDLRVNLWQGPRTGGDIADVMLHVPAAQEFGLRDEFVFPIGRYYTEELALLVDPSQVGDGETLALFTQYKLGVELDTIAELYLSSPYTAQGRIGPNVVRYRDFSDAVEGLKQGEVAGLMGPRAQLEMAATEVDRPVKIVEPPFPGLDKRSWDLGIAVRADSRHLGYVLADMLTEMRKTGELQKIFAEHGLSYNANFTD